MIIYPPWVYVFKYTFISLSFLFLDVTAIRSMQWKVWDVMWGFHIMDWQERDNIDNLFLKIFSILALISSITGILLFFKVDIKK